MTIHVIRDSSLLGSLQFFTYFRKDHKLHETYLIIHVSQIHMTYRHTATCSCNLSPFDQLSSRNILTGANRQFHIKTPTSWDVILKILELCNLSAT